MNTERQEHKPIEVIKVNKISYSDVDVEEGGWEEFVLYEKYLLKKHNYVFTQPDEEMNIPVTTTSEGETIVLKSNIRGVDYFKSEIGTCYTVTPLTVDNDCDKLQSQFNSKKDALEMRNTLLNWLLT